MLTRGLDGKWGPVVFNELQHLRHPVVSPAHHPFLHIQGYYKDLDWERYKISKQLRAERDKEAEDQNQLEVSTKHAMIPSPQLPRSRPLEKAS